MYYGIELEFFIVDVDNDLVPACKVTNNLDGNPIIGEIKTKVHPNIVDCIFELNKLIYQENAKIVSKGYFMRIAPQYKVSDSFLINLRKDKAYINRKQLEILETFSIYPKGKVAKVLPKGLYKASLQISFSDNKEFVYSEYEKITVEDKSKYISKSKNKVYSTVFNYVDIIYKLDEAFASEIKAAERIKGVYAIKEGVTGDRIEYRSLPNNIDFSKLLKLLDEDKACDI